MLFFSRFKRKSGSSTRSRFRENTYKEMPGYSIRSVDDLRFEALRFEKLVKNYIAFKAGHLPERNLNFLINNILPKYPLDPEIQTQWPAFVAEVNVLRVYRNKLVHSEFYDMPEISELCSRFEKCNATLSRFRMGAGYNRRFKPKRWTGDVLEIEIDETLYELQPEDVQNLLIELHPASRGKVHFIKGRIVTSKVLDYYYEKVTYFIEDFPQFELSEDESMSLEHLLNLVIGEHLYGSQS